MNILIFIPYLSQNWGGVRQYSIGLIKTLINDNTNHYFIYHNNNDPEVIYLLSTYKNLNLVKDEHVKGQWLTRNTNKLKRVCNILFRILRIDKKYQLIFNIDQICKKNRIDVIHCPYQYIPDIPAESKIKLITTLHDVQEIHFPEYFTAEERLHRAKHFLDYVRRADKIVVSYNHVKNDLIKYFQVEENRIYIILLDMGNLWFEKYNTYYPQNNETFNGYGKFLLYPANTWKHKNHIRLLEALSLLKNDYNIIVNIICTGHLLDYYQEEIYPKLKELNLLDQVTFKGIVDESTLLSLYKNAVGVVIPTIYEAGSFPLMESILLKVPVICSNVTSLPETIGNDMFVFNPTDITEMSQKIALLWQSEEFRKDSIRNSCKIEHSLKHTGALDKFLILYNG